MVEPGGIEHSAGYVSSQPQQKTGKKLSFNASYKALYEMPFTTTSGNSRMQMSMNISIKAKHLVSPAPLEELVPIIEEDHT